MSYFFISLPEARTTYQNQLMAEFNQQEMTDRQRQLYFQIIDNKKEIHSIAFKLYFLAEYFPPNKLDRALHWLVRHRIIGDEFLKWHKEKCDGSDLQMHKVLLHVVDNLEPDAIIAGKNFKI